MLRWARNVLLMVVGVCAVAASLATAQSGVFRAAPTYILGGGTGDSTPLVALIDVGSPAGPLDGIPDIATAQQSTMAVKVLFGVGDGTFLTAPVTVLNIIPSAMVVANLTGDTAPDMLVGDSSLRSVTFFRGFSDGPPFEQGATVSITDVPAGSHPTGIAVAKLNADENVDAVVAFDQVPGKVAVLIGDGNGGFTQLGVVVATEKDISAIAVGEFTGDDQTDVVVTSGDRDTVTILRGDGQGGFTVAQTVQMPTGTNPVAVVAVNLNSDNRLDLVLADQNNTVAVMLGLAGGGFGAPQFFVGGLDPGDARNGLAVADVNGDGRLDAITPTNHGVDVCVLLGDGTGKFGAPRAFVADLEPVGIAAGDVNNDQIADVITVNQGGQQPNAAVLLGRDDGTLAAVEDVLAGSSPKSVVTGDLNNDGVADLIVARVGGHVELLLADPVSGFAPSPGGPLASGGDALGVGRGDLNRDGLLDIVVANNVSASLAVFLARPQGGFGAATMYSLVGNGGAVAIGDWNGDGRPDVAVTEQGGTGNGDVAVFLGTGDGTLGPRTAYGVGEQPVAMDMGDFNKDGHLDLAVANGGGSGSVSILIGDGAGGFTAGTTISNQSNPVAVAVADFDRDGFDDVAIGRGIAQRVPVEYSNGQGGFTLGQDLSVTGVTSSVTARDVTGDGLPDLVVSSQGQLNYTTAYRKLANNRSFQADAPVVVSRQPLAGAVGDFQGDGRYDGVALCGSGGGIASVMTNIAAPAILRGDGNGDAAVSAADLVALMNQMSGSRRIPVENVLRDGHYAPEFDANGDGLVTPQDAQAMAHRTFEAVL